MDIGKLLLMGAAGFVAYEYFTGAFSSPVVAAPTSGGIQPGPTPPVSAANPTTTRAMVLAAANKGSFTQGTVDQWDTFYQSARGIPAPGPESWGVTPDTRGQILTFDEWWNLASSHGLSGTRGGYRRASY